MSKIANRFSMPAFFARVMLIVAFGFSAVGHAAESNAMESSSAKSNTPESSAKAPASPSYKKAYEKFLEISKSNAVLNSLTNGQTFDMLLKQIEAEAGSGITPAQKKEIEKIMRTTFTEISNTMKDAMLEIYQKYYTESDLNELSAFYQSGVGKKFADNMMNVIYDSQELVQFIIVRYLPEMQQKVEAVLEQSSKSGKSSKPSQSSPSTSKQSTSK